MHVRVYSDFDGTIAQRDVTDLVLEHFAPQAWQALEAAWLRGDIDSATCMAQQIALIECEKAELDALLDTVEIDPGFIEFANWCAKQAAPLTVVSDGVDYFIKRILRRHGLGELPLFANRLVWSPPRVGLLSPWREAACRSRSGVCKCAIAKPAESVLVYIGDGRSDECVAMESDILFAKSGLATFCRANARAFHPFETFDDVRGVLATVVKELSHNNPGLLLRPTQT